jgi:hypothetical protein
MKFLQAKTTWTNAEFGLFKICVISYGMLIGIYFHTFLENWVFPLWIILSITGTATLLLWIKKMKHQQALHEA